VFEFNSFTIYRAQRQSGNPTALSVCERDSRFYYLSVSNNCFSLRYICRSITATKAEHAYCQQYVCVFFWPSFGPFLNWPQKSTTCQPINKRFAWLMEKIFFSLLPEVKLLELSSNATLPPLNWVVGWMWVEGTTDVCHPKHNLPQMWMWTGETL